MPEPATRGWELSGGLWLLWAGTGVSATLASAGVHWTFVQLSGLIFYATWAYFNIESRMVLRSFFFLCAKLFFKHFDVAGSVRVPPTGPVILAIAPHSNQFVDGIVVLRGISHRPDLSFIVAAVTMRRKYVGAMARMIGGVAVERSQDLKHGGTGRISVDEGSISVRGEGTKFATELKKGDCILIGKESLQISEVNNDSEVTLRTGAPTAHSGVPFRIEPYVDQKKMFDDVYDHLGAGKCLGIFPEGGSHDRTELLELKAGLTIMALGAMDKYPGLQVKIVPVGLNYFKGHRFRSRVFVDIGQAIVPTQDQLARFRAGGADKRSACGELLASVTDGVRAVTVQAPDYDALQFFRLMRRLYLPSEAPEHQSARQRFALMRSFSEGYNQLRDSQDVRELYRNVLMYRRMLRSHAIPDHAVATGKIRKKLSVLNTVRNLAKTLFLLLLFLLASVPGGVLCMPLIIVTRVISNIKAQEAVRKSTVKLAGRDVLATWKLLVSFVMLPVMHILYTSLACIAYGTTGGIAYFFFSPFLGGFTVIAFEQVANRVREARVLLWDLWQSEDGQWLAEFREAIQQQTHKVIEQHDWDKKLTSEADLYRLGDGWSTDGLLDYSPRDSRSSRAQGDKPHKS
eukprot:TRINITY_DN14450_c0_g1_i1.p1 TRINITY_DN14450_c0_g1~~TRINITY_DN14450_c0_g1_i1.p1  ORF type:complete len:628 (+),score=177.32 TRINITY_DN14450_c0_g1_i1:83-1966(+)